MIAPLVLIGGLCLILLFQTEDSTMRLGLLLTSSIMFLGAADIAFSGSLGITTPIIAIALVPMSAFILYGLAVDPAQ